MLRVSGVGVASPNVLLSLLFYTAAMTPSIGVFVEFEAENQLKGTRIAIRVIGHQPERRVPTPPYGG